MKRVCSFTVVFFLMLLAVVKSETESGLVVTYPKTIRLNSTEKICFTSAKLVGEILIQGRLMFNRRGCLSIELEAWRSVASQGSSTDGCIEFSTHCPYTNSRQRLPNRGDLTLRVDSQKTDGNYFQENYEWTINVSPLRTETFIQSDKPIYQPSQQVLFRVMTVQYPDVAPDIQSKKDIWITSPSQSRMQQWRDQVSSDGLLDLNFQLSSEPELGTWRIHVQEHGGPKTVQTFLVEEYVLPKFEVSIQAPTYLYSAQAGPLTMQICAMYTYGQPVSGRVAVNISHGALPHYHFVARNMPPYLPAEAEADSVTGCAEVQLTNDQLNQLLVSSSFFRNDVQKLAVKANFTEAGTGVTFSASREIPVYNEPVRVNIEGPDVYKPLLPYHGKIVVTHPDGRSAGVWNVSLNAASRTLTLQTKSDGTVDFEVDTSREASQTDMTISASVRWDRLLGNSRRTLPPSKQSEKTIKAWYSPSGSFLQVLDLPQISTADQTLPVNIQFTLPNSETQIQIFYRVISGGRILSHGSHYWVQSAGEDTTQGDLPFIPPELEVVSRTSASSRSNQRHRFSMPYGPSYEFVAPELSDYSTDGTKGESTFFIDVVSEMSPKGQILVYYIREDGEVVSASRNFKMASSFKNQVSLEFLEGREVRPGEAASVSISAQPSSLCAVGVVDKSVHLMGGNNQLTKSKVLNPLNSLNVISGSLSTRCPSERSSSFSSRHADSLEGFRTAGVGVMTDLRLETRPCWERRQLPCSSWWCMPMHRQMFHVPMANMRPRGDVMQEVPPQVMFMQDLDFNVLERDVSEWLTEPEEEPAPLVQIRSYFPETWLWKLTRLGANGNEVMEADIPHTITDWVANAFCLSTEYGVGVAETTSIRAFQPFFLSYTKPYSVIRGEKVPIKVTVFNYLSSCLNIQVSMIETLNFTIEERPISESIDVCGNAAETLQYEIIPLALGDVPIRVTASAEPTAERGDVPVDDATFPVTDAIEDTVLVEPEGVGREETFSELICPQDAADDRYEQTVSLQVPSSVVPGSARGRVQVIGDIMGSVMSNLDSLLRMPFGCGEQNMIFMAPNIYVMQYLTFTHQLTPDIKEKALKFMSSGYQRELNYELSDHSYSAFGESDGEGSTWLTAFVLKCFTEAQDFMDIDENKLASTRRWLQNNPRDESGCVITQGRVIHKEMQGSVSSPVTMTAFVTIALLEAGASQWNIGVRQGLQCIRSFYETEGETMDTYTLAIISYALGLGQEGQLQSQVLQALNQRAHTQDGLVHWRKSESGEMEETSCYGHCKEDSSATEITAYVLLAYLHQMNKTSASMLAESMPMVKWLNTQRNALGGFGSTQDTVLGLQALSQFGSLSYNPESPLSMRVNVNASRAPPHGHQLHNFMVEASNRLVLQRSELEEVPTTLHVTATGSGCSLFQAELLYNVPVSRPSRPVFEITASITDWESNSVIDSAACGDKTLEICVWYHGSDEETGMSTMEIKMVSGYVPHEQSLNEFQNTPAANHIGFKRFDKYKAGEPLSLYFDKFDGEGRCIPINLKQEFFVKEAKDAFIKVYDYYKPSVVGYKDYNTCETDM